MDYLYFLNENFKFPEKYKCVFYVKEGLILEKRLFLDFSKIGGGVRSALCETTKFISLLKRIETFFKA